MIRKASIDEEGRVFHQLSRNAFALDIAEGDLDEVQIRCDNKLSRYDLFLLNVQKVLLLEFHILSKHMDIL